MSKLIQNNAKTKRNTVASIRKQKQKLSDGELNPGLARDRGGY